MCKLELLKNLEISINTLINSDLKDYSLNSPEIINIIKNYYGIFNDGK